MFVLSLSGRPGHGRTAVDPVPALLAALEELDLPLAPERTAGPDALVLAGRAEEALEVLLRAAEVGGFALGLGVGAVQRPRPGSGREVAGHAVTAAAGSAGLPGRPSPPRTRRSAPPGPPPRCPPPSAPPTTATGTPPPTCRPCCDWSAG